MIEELLIYAVALGILATFFVPILFSATGKFLPASISPNVMLPNTYPKTGAAILYTVIFWGLFMYLGLWLITKFQPVKRASESV
jgi:hypothetical protein